MSWAEKTKKKLSFIMYKCLLSKLNLHISQNNLSTGVFCTARTGQITESTVCTVDQIKSKQCLYFYLSNSIKVFGFSRYLIAFQ